MAETSANYGIEIGERSVSGFVAYIAQFDPQFPERIKGATEEEITQLEETVRQPLPAEYKDFLRHLGNGCDHLVFAGECHTDAASISESYKGLYEDLDAGYSAEEVDSPPESCLVIGAFCLFSDEMCLDLRVEGITPVVIMDSGNLLFYSDSLLQLVYCRGYTAYRLRVLPQFKFFADYQRPPAERGSFERAVAWASSAPWSRQWFSDAECLCVEGPDIAFCLTFFEQTGYTLHIGGAAGSNLEETVQAISQVIGVALKDTPLDPE